MVRQLDKRVNDPYSSPSSNEVFNNLTNRQRWRGPQSSTSNIISMYTEKSHPGKLLIFNHTVFEINDKKPRNGTKIDEVNLNECFGTCFGYNVYVYQDYKCDDIFKTLVQEANQNEVNYGCLMVIILTYGDNNGLYARDTIYSLDTLFKVFENRLPDIPKVFLFQFGRDNEIKVPIKYPEDMLVVYSCNGTQCSYRNVDEGSWFISVLTKHLKNLKEQSVLTYEIDHVCKKVERMSVNNGTIQQPEFISTLKKILFIKPLKKE